MHLIIIENNMLNWSNLGIGKGLLKANFLKYVDKRWINSVGRMIKPVVEALL